MVIQKRHAGVVYGRINAVQPCFQGCVSVPGEGKTTTSVNFALSLVPLGKKILLIDADLRIPSIARKMKINSTPGLTDCFKDVDADEFNFYQSDFFNNWYILPTGNLPPNPSELLGSSRMEKVLNKLKQHFDYIIVDLPPVNLVSDAVAISKYITGMIVVVREDYAEKQELETCFRQLKLSNVNVLGCVINETKNGKYYYNRYRYKKYYKYYKHQNIVFYCKFLNMSKLW